MKKSKKKIKKANSRDKAQSNEFSDMVEAEKNFFEKTPNHDRERLEKWQIGKKNFP